MSSAKIKINLDHIEKFLIILFLIGQFIFSSSENGIWWDVITGILILYGLFTMINGKKIILDYYLLWFVLVFLLFGISVIYSHNFTLASYAISNQFRSLIYCTVFMIIVRRNNNTNCALLGMLLAALILSIYMLANADWTYILTTSVQYANRLRLGLNSNQHVNITAYNLTIGFAAGMIYYRLHSEDWKIFYKIILWISEVIIIFAIFSTGARKTLLSVAFMVIIMFWDKKRMWKIIAGVAFAIVAVYAVLNVPVLYHLIGSRVEIVLNGTGDASTNERIQLMQEAFKVFLSNPVFGVGINQFQTLSTAKVYAHNNFLELLADLGIIGFSVYYSIFVRIFSELKRNRIFGYREKTVLYGAVINLLILDIFQISYNLNTSMILIAVLSLTVNGIYDSEVLQPNIGD